MDRDSKKCIKTSLKLANSVMFITGIAILMYSVWLVVVCLRDYRFGIYPFPWFLWACIGAGSTFSLIAFVGHAGASTRSNFLLSLYILSMFLLILVECLVTADIFLNDHWDKDFPKDHTRRFDDFVDFVDSNEDNFKCLGVLISFSQVLAFLLAVVLRTMRLSERNRRIYEDEEIVSAKHPFLLGHEPQYCHLSYAVGLPDPQYYYLAPPYMHTDMNSHTHTHTHTRAYDYPDITCIGNEKGECVAPTAQASSKA